MSDGLGKFEEFADQWNTVILERWRNTHINVMVFGPSTSARTPGGRLRKFLIAQCEGHGITVRGEHKQLIAMYKRMRGPGHNLCSMELDLAANAVHALVIIPDSPGSLAELGLFALARDICSRTLVLFSHTHLRARKDSFIRLGPKLAYEQRGALIEYVDYAQQQLVWQKVDDFLVKFRGFRYDELVLRR